MTREEAIADIRDNIKPVVGGISLDMAIEALEQQPNVINEIPKDYKYDTETKDFLVYRHKYTGDEIHIEKPIPLYMLKQQPCEDCISRQDVNDLVEELARVISDERCCISRGKRTIMQDILDLPSVTPKEKTGKWIMHPKGIYAHLVCNKCLSSAPYNCQTNYCPNCGARMTESEDKK